MKERPILFSAPMVRAILEGSKTQTRRIVKPQRHPFGDMLNADEVAAQVVGGTCAMLCPYGQVGDRLWVRENFQPFFTDGIVDLAKTNWKTGEGFAISYPATDGVQEFFDTNDNLTDTVKPSIHMPRWASRILLEVVSVRVERLQDISEADAKSEGVIYDRIGQCWFPTEADTTACAYAIGAYVQLWESINGVGSWDTNPWVWVVEFRMVKTNSGRNANSKEGLTHD